MAITKQNLKALIDAYDKEAAGIEQEIQRQRTEASKETPKSFLTAKKMEGKRGVTLPFKRLGVKPQDLVAAYASMGASPEINGNTIHLSPADLRAIVKHREKRGTVFNRSVRGMPYSQLLRTSTAADKLRAKTVRSAVMYGRKGNIFYFRVSGNANPFYRVQLRLEGWENALTNATPALKAVEEIIRGNISIECPCGRHQYWYRYLATIGQFAIAPLEKDFPKIRNPNLKGCCCKHVLKSLHDLRLSRVKFQLVRELEKDRKRAGFTGGNRRKLFTEKELQEAMKKRISRKAQELFSKHKEATEKFKQEMQKKNEKEVKKKSVSEKALISAIKNALKAARTLGMSPDVMLDTIAQHQNTPREKIDQIIKDNNL